MNKLKFLKKKNKLKCYCYYYISFFMIKIIDRIKIT